MEEPDWLKHQRAMLREFRRVRDLNSACGGDVESAQGALARVGLQQELAVQRAAVSLPTDRDTNSQLERSAEDVRRTAEAVQHLVVREEIRRDGQKAMALCRQILDTLEDDDFIEKAALSLHRQGLRGAIARFSRRGGTTLTVGDPPLLLSRAQELLEKAIGVARGAHEQASRALSQTQADPGGVWAGVLVAFLVFWVLLIAIGGEAFFMVLFVSIAVGFGVRGAVASSNIGRVADMERRARSSVEALERLVPKVQEAQRPYREWHQRQSRELARPQIQALLGQGRLVEAARLYRAVTGASVENARAAFPQLNSAHISNDDLLLDHERGSSGFEYEDEGDDDDDDD